ncbi:MAG: deoxyguanosinetriphosphate triphosphohydrolase [Candidatus Gastranaerophilales bacterium]|nr:deoxyguanosinetriphosphate triphosphohydrolase [Candidatus Gastranaerophilales bacterium]
MKTFDIKDLKSDYEEFEVGFLSIYACKSANSRGRFHEEKECLLRTVFQRDRDKILHSKAFRRLKHKTQVFVSPIGDHYRTRLTHTLEVSQIARTISRALRLNEDLTEAIALGHDLGHTPFGHTGEEVLNELLPGGFSHNKQSIRVVTVIEPLNLTKETLDGIENHTGDNIPFTLEGQVVRISDRIAYLNHDIDDAIRADMISLSDLPIQCLDYFGHNKSQSITKMVFDIIENSLDKNEISMSNECKDNMNILRKWLFDNVYSTKNEELKAKKIVHELFEFYVNLIQKKYNCEDKDLVLRIAADYLAGMTDRYAMKKYKQFFLPANHLLEETDTFLYKLAQQNGLNEKI